MKTRHDGKDLIVVFNGKGSGIGPDEFAPKLIGRDTKGRLLFGYARLPYVDYRPALLSTRRPIADKETNQLKLTIENFGLSDSQPAKAEVWSNSQLVASGDVKALKPYEAAELSLNPAAPLGGCVRGCHQPRRPGAGARQLSTGQTVRYTNP